MTAIGTVFAVVLALALALAPVVRRHRRRARLTLVTGRGEPFLRPIHDNGISIDELRLRVGLHNLGRSTALDVRAVLQNWWERGENGRWQELDVDPLPMKWITTRPGDDRVGDPVVAIVPDTTEYLDVAIWRPGGIELVVDDGRQALFERRRSPAIGVWRVAFAVVGTDLEPSRFTVEFECDGRHYVSRVEESVPPETAQHVGLVRLLSQLSQELKDEQSEPE